MPKFIQIIGPQAVGKMTVGQELAKITNYKLLYNHMTIEMVRLIFDYDKEVFRKMNSIIRYEIFLSYYSKEVEMDMKFEKISEEWLKYKKPSIKQSTYSNYYGVVMNRLLKKLKGKTIKQLLKYDFNDYVMYLVNKGLDSKTIRDTIKVLKQILRYAEMKYDVDLNINLINVPKMTENIKRLKNTC